MERFGEDAQGIGGEIRRKRTQTKDDILYGVFASGDGVFDSDSYNANKRRKYYSKPVKFVKFVSSGSVMPSPEIDHNELLKKRRKYYSKPVNLVSSGSVMLSPEIDHNEILKKSCKGSTGVVGSFEKHTKGIGMKLLEKMGYKGGGLGKNEQGIVAPIEPKLHPKNMGMGFNDSSEAAPLSLGGENKFRQSLECHSKEKLWLNKAPKKKVYITAHELKQDRGFDFVQKVFDKMGPKVRILTKLENLSADVKSRENDVPVNLAEVDLQKLDNDPRNERKAVVALLKEKEKLRREKKKLENMEEVLSVLYQIDNESSSGDLTLESLAKSFHDLQTRYTVDNTLCNSFALPLFIKIFQGRDPTHGVEAISLWENVFDSASWEHLMVKYIIPKLLAVMHDLPTLEQLYFVRTWATAIPTHHMVKLIDVFFDKWQGMLYHWLCSKPKFEEVTKWYLVWKELLPPELLANEHVWYGLNLGLRMMRQTVKGVEVGPPGLRQFGTRKKGEQLLELHNRSKLKRR